MLETLRIWRENRKRIGGALGFFLGACIPFLVLSLLSVILDGPLPPFFMILTVVFFTLFGVSITLYVITLLKRGRCPQCRRFIKGALLVKSCPYCSVQLVAEKGDIVADYKLHQEEEETNNGENPAGSEKRTR